MVEDMWIDLLMWEGEEKEEEFKRNEEEEEEEEEKIALKREKRQERGKAELWERSLPTQSTIWHGSSFPSYTFLSDTLTKHHCTEPNLTHILATT